MCGIAGILNKAFSASTDTRLIERMLATIEHRGPDGWGTYSSDGIHLGHVRLSIVDLSGGHQPMMTDKYVISFNGEVYNHIELRAELESLGATFHTTCDTEVIIKAYEQWGMDAVKKFNGQFAFLLWDRQEKRLIIARDRYAIRPLYVLNHQGAIYFASEIKAFDPIPGYRRELDMDNLFEHALFWNTLADKTVYKNIRSVPGGTYEIYSTDGLSVQERYYSLGESTPDLPANFNAACAELRETLKDATRLRLRSDVPVGAYLSGGIDSSVITHLVSQINRERLQTFSVAFEDDDFDESSYQQDMIRQLSSEHYELKISYKMVEENFYNVIHHTDRPLFRTAPVPLYLLSDAVRKAGFKVVLTGEASDEVLWGYDSYKELKLLQFWAKHPESKLRPQLIKRLYPHLKHFNDPRQFGLMRMYYEGFLDSYDNEMASLNIRVSNNSILKNYFNRDRKVVLDKEKLLADVKETLPKDYYDWSLLQRNQYMEMRTLLSGYLLSSQGDRMSMAHSVEGRYPFLDHRLIEQSFHYPAAYKMHVLSQKHILRETFRKDIPASIIDRPKLPYMAPDLKSFFAGGTLSERASDLLSEKKLKDYGVFDSTMVNRFISKYERNVPEKLGYRDNMLICFLLSTQYLLDAPPTIKVSPLSPELRTVTIADHV
ncbi:MAG: asparagine synthase (glutamine-hydrolyzing) [Deltaproteobacteria bacterium]|nr:asparagine synthase (glutamine-hydrolyzing) [Deltaproteobacteria bacterium]